MEEKTDMKQVLFLFTFISILSMSCARQEEQPNFQDPDYILFGHFYGHCIGEQCIEMFKMTDSALYEDISDTYPRWDRYDEGQFVQLDQTVFDQVKSLRDEIPDQLLTAQDTVFGCPDCADGGGIYFAIRDGENTRYWLIDQMANNLPEYLKNFKTRINESIALIND